MKMAGALPVVEGGCCLDTGCSTVRAGHGKGFRYFVLWGNCYALPVCSKCGKKFGGEFEDAPLTQVVKGTRTDLACKVLRGLRESKLNRETLTKAKGLQDRRSKTPWSQIDNKNRMLQNGTWQNAPDLRFCPQPHFFMSFKVHSTRGGEPMLSVFESILDGLGLVPKLEKAWGLPSGCLSIAVSGSTALQAGAGTGASFGWQEAHQQYGSVVLGRSDVTGRITFFDYGRSKFQIGKGDLVCWRNFDAKGKLMLEACHGTSQPLPPLASRVP